METRLECVNVLIIMSFLKSASPEFLMELVVKQFFFIVKNYKFFEVNNIRININVDLSTFISLSESACRVVLDNFHVINFEIELCRSFPATEGAKFVIAPYRGRMLLDDVSAENILLAGDLLKEFRFIKIDKRFFGVAGIILKEKVF